MITDLIIICLVVATLTRTLVWEEIAREVREFVKVKAHPKLAYLVTCDYCSSHWVALVVLLLSGFRLDGWGLLVTLFAVVAVTNAMMLAYSKARVSYTETKTRLRLQEETLQRARDKAAVQQRGVRLVNNMGECKTCQTVDARTA